MMIGRLGDSDGEAWPCWPFSASTSGMAACTPVPAATAPSTDVFTKSRRENVTSPPDVRLAKKIIYKKITSGVAGEPGSISRATNGFTRNAVSASKGDPLSSKSIRSKEKGANNFAPLGQETLRVTTSTSAGETPAGQPARCRRHTHLLANLRKRPG